MGSNSSLPEDMDAIWGEKWGWGCCTRQATEKKGYCALHVGCQSALQATLHKTIPDLSTLNIW